MLWSRAISVTLSPTAGVCVVPLVTVPVMVAAEAAADHNPAISRHCAAILRGERFDFIFATNSRRAPTVQFRQAPRQLRSPDRRAARRNLPPNICPRCTRNSSREDCRTTRLSARAENRGGSWASGAQYAAEEKRRRQKSPTEEGHRQWCSYFGLAANSVGGGGKAGCVGGGRHRYGTHLPVADDQQYSCDTEKEHERRQDPCEMVKPGEHRRGEDYRPILLLEVVEDSVVAIAPGNRRRQFGEHHRRNGTADMIAFAQQLITTA